MSAKLVAILPKTAIVNKAKFQKEFVAAFNEATRGMLEDYKVTTRTWTHKVRFVASKPSSSGGGEFSATVGTDDKIYGFVDRGTRRHIIRPKRGKRLSFRTGYIARTVPRVLHSGRSSYRGGWASAKAVKHPGTQARRFTIIIQIKWQTKFEERMKAANERAATS